MEATKCASDFCNITMLRAAAIHYLLAHAANCGNDLSSNGSIKLATIRSVRLYSR